ncbi:MAG TPA: hypothetical protein DCG28_03615 [Lachnospiraceae bacterium]|nr:hypothetical protein [Lachnospiraceae bacterium]
MLTFKTKNISNSKPPVFTFWGLAVFILIIKISALNDTVVSQREGETLDVAYDFEDYRKKVNRYIEEHGDTLVIHKLKKYAFNSIGL